MDFDVINLVQSIPWVGSHSWSMVVIGFALWGGAHLFANIPAPTDQSNPVWKSVYPLLNSVVAANYKHATSVLANVEKEIK